MLRLFGHYLPGAMLVLGLVEMVILVLAFYVGIFSRYGDSSRLAEELVRYAPEATIYVAALTLVMIALGVYQREAVIDMRTILVRLIAALVLSFVLMAAIFYIYPPVIIWRSTVAIAMILSFLGIFGLRGMLSLFGRLSPFRRRILILGAGHQAAQIATYERDGHHHGFAAVGYLRLTDGETDVAGSRDLAELDSLVSYALEHQVEEIVVAAQERRGSLPVRSLLDCRLRGIKVTDYTAFWERETGRVDLSRLHPSWLVFSDGFVDSWSKRAIKRGFDVLASLLLLGASAPALCLAMLAIRYDDRGPLLFRQTRVGQDGRPFDLLKLRTMRCDAEADGVPRWASEQDPRITRTGRVLRRTRIDEIPQIINVLKGDMSFVGPRPERPYFVEDLAERIPYYADRHRVKPGISGWAQLNYPYGASIDDARRKLEYDLYYVKNGSVFLDCLILLQTLRVVIWPHGVR